jgi:hypothetical protein
MHQNQEHMKKLLFVSLSTFTMLSGFSQSDNGRETRKVSSFHGVAVSGGIDLYIGSGPESVSVSASSDDIRNHMKTEVEDGILHIYLDPSWRPAYGGSGMKAYVTLSSMDMLEGSGGGDIVLQDEIKTGDLHIRMSGGGNLKGKLNADHLVISQSGGSNVNLSGNVENLDLNASGGGSLHGYALVTDFASIHASGGSNTEITVNKELRVVVSGGGDVYYKGSASVKEIKSSGGGSVSHKD